MLLETINRIMFMFDGGHELDETRVLMRSEMSIREDMESSREFRVTIESRSQ